MDTRLPTGTVTFLLTDVEVPTQAGEAARAAVASATVRLREIVDAHVTAYTGARPVTEGEGDGTVAVFPLASVIAASSAEPTCMVGRASGARSANSRTDSHSASSLPVGNPSDGTR